MTELYEKHCEACEGGVAALSVAEATKLMNKLNQWNLTNDATVIFKDFQFKNYYQTMAFVNAVAWIAHHENHHPDLEVHYNHCKVSYQTHAINGLSDNDFICAAKIDRL